MILFLFTLFFLGCADKNAFDNFEMIKEQELSANNLQNSKIKTGDNTDGIISAIYLNKVYPTLYNQNEYFYIYLYQRERVDMFNPNTLDEINMTLKLNGKLPIKIRKLSHNNRFSHLTLVNGEWQRYFLVAFEEEKSNKLSLILQTSLSSSDFLIYHKDE
ncbi:MAG: hypothetical protein U9N33_02855 [Campylobacterota bacterium]|nr:hypothetical protein [Campylobacterota bacterium]